MTERFCFAFGNWDIGFIWYLVLVIWCLFRIVGKYGDNPFPIIGIEEET